MSEAAEAGGRREMRLRFLEALYRASEEGAGVYEDAYLIAEALGLTRLDAERIVRYWEDLGFVKNTSVTGLSVRITAQGIDHIETTSET